MKFTIDKEIFSRFAPIKIAVAALENINNNVDIGAFFDAEYSAIEKLVADKLDGAELSDLPVVRRWREIYKSFGEKDARSSVESLIKRVKNGKGLYRINPLVDIYNLCSLRFGLPAGGEDADAFASDLELTFANGDENFLPLGETAIEHPNPGEAVYKFGDTIVCRNFNYYESDVTKLTAGTKRAVLVFEDALDDEPNLRAALDWIGEKAGLLLGANVAASAVLCADENEFIIK